MLKKKFFIISLALLFSPNFTMAYTDKSPTERFKWMPSMGVIEFWPNGQNGRLISNFWWNDTSGFDSIHSAYEHEIRLTPFDTLEATATWRPASEVRNGSLSFLSEPEATLKNRILNPENILDETSRSSVYLNIPQIIEPYVDTRFLDNWSLNIPDLLGGFARNMNIDPAPISETDMSKAFTVGIRQARALSPRNLYKTAFDIKTDGGGVVNLTLAPQLSHWADTYPDAEFNSLVNKYFNFDEPWFCNDYFTRLCEPGDPNCNGSQACIFSSYGKDNILLNEPFSTDAPFKKVWATGIGWEFSKNRDRDSIFNLKDEGPVKHENADKIREVYNAQNYTATVSGEEYPCNKIGTPYNDNEGGYYVHSWSGILLQTFKQSN